MVSMLDCIRRVPSILDRILEKREDTFAPLWKTIGDDVTRLDEIVLIGSGTSNTSAITAKFLTEKASGLRVSALTPTEFLYHLSARNSKALYVFISQTGTSIMTRKALAFVKENGWLSTAISEKSDTTIAKEADVFIDMGCGYEEYPMRSIGYSATVLTVILLGMEIGRKREALPCAVYEDYLQQASSAAGNIHSVIDRTMDWLTYHRRNMLRADCLVFTGTGALYGVALEGAVKAWETPQIISIGYELEEGLHGPNYGYNARHCVIVLDDGSIENDKAVALCKYMKYEHHNGFLVGKGAVDDQDLALEPQGGGFACLEFAAVVQVIAYRLAEEQGRDLFAPHDNNAMMQYFRSHEDVE
ncbi:MAG: SIS domain-containing protein [Acetanaerobacterium sp.]